MNQNSADEDVIAQRWYVLNFLCPFPSGKVAAAESCVSQFNRKQNSSLQFFMPTFITYRDKNGKREKFDSPLTFHYAFVRGSFPDVKKLCGEPNDFSFVIDKSGQSRYAVVDDNVMDNFRKVALRYSNKVPFYSLDGINLEDCDKVEVVEGDFPGLVGYFQPNARRSKGRIILRLTQGMGTVAYDINAKYLRILEFSKNFRRAYDIIDDFVPKLFAAMRKYHASAPLSEKEISGLKSFSRRMGACHLDNPKIEAKLQAMLFITEMILGNEEEAEVIARILESKQRSVTSNATRAFILLILAIGKADAATFRDGLEILRAIEGKDSRSLRSLRSEYDHYIGTETFLFPH